MIHNQAGIQGWAHQCNDGLWRITTLGDDPKFTGIYPITPDGFTSESQCYSWWKNTGKLNQCRVCGMGFYAARDDGAFCRPACRAKFNRHQQGASEHVGTGAYWQRPEENRTHKKRADEFTYKCEWCGRTCTARAEAKRSGERAPKYCNDNGGRCRQAAYRAARSSKNRKSGPQHDPAGNRQNTPPYGGHRHTDRPPERKANDTAHDGPPRHSGPWRSTRDASAWLVDAMCYVKKIPRSAWSQSGNVKELRGWARTYIAENHPDRTGKAADTFYKTVSDCYSYLRKHA